MPQGKALPEDEPERTVVLRVPAAAGRDAAPRGSGGSGRPAGSAGAPPEPARRHSPGAVLAGAASVLVLVAVGAFVVGTGGGGKAGDAAPAASPAVPGTQGPSGGVRCSGDDCTGHDPEAMGCGGPHARTVAQAPVDGAHVEIRYSGACRAAWARVTGAARGDTLSVTARDAAQEETVGEAGEAYTPMVAAADPAAPSACVVSAAGPRGCVEG
ncbi:DUF2690 domain-containing protein [Streptomyces sp. URMC 125]